MSEVSQEGLLELIPRFSDKKVLIVGDLCLDEYIVGRSRQDAPHASSDANTRVKIERGDEWLRISSARFTKTLK